MPQAAARMLNLVSFSSPSPLTPGKLSGTSHCRSHLIVLAAPFPCCTLAKPSSAFALPQQRSTPFLNEFPSTSRKGKKKREKKRRRDHILMSCQAYSLHIPIRLTDKWSWPVCQADLSQCPLPAPSPQPCSVPPLQYRTEITILLGSL